MSNSLNLQKRAKAIRKTLPSMTYTLGRGLLQPFNDTNSGSRKILQGIQKEQSIQIVHPEPPIVMTGFENKFGELSSDFIVAKSNYRVISKIKKNDMTYCAILYDFENNVLDCKICSQYEYRTEYYGFMVNNRGVDAADVGEIIPKGTVLSSSASYDESYNKADGVNLSIAYIATALTSEDPIVISESAAKRLSSPVFSELEIIINENDIPLNLYGNDEFYKIMPNIGESVKKGIICAIRREDVESLYSQSKDRLKEIMISDTTYVAEGEVIDIDIYCNNPENLEDMYYQQLRTLYDEKNAYCRDIFTTVDTFIKQHPNVKMSYDLEKIYSRCKDVVNNVSYMKDKVFNNVILHIIVKSNKVSEVGDKITDRYGGKGVISAILKDEMMPMYYRNGEYHSIEAIYNSSTIVNRLNPGQSFETEITWIGSKLLEFLCGMWYREKNKDIENRVTNFTDELLPQCEREIYKFYSTISKELAETWRNEILNDNIETRKMSLESLFELGDIPIVIRPNDYRDRVDIDILKTMYELFSYLPEIGGESLYVKQKDSTGNYRTIPSRRKMVVGKKYIYKLKQFAKEKFSAVSLASTNIRGENTKTKANKFHTFPFSKTPVRLGNMEIGELMQLPQYQCVVEAFMMLSTSPIARRFMIQLLIGDPLDRNIVLNENATSRNVEIANVYLKCMGLRLTFKKKENIKPMPIYMDCITVNEKRENVKQDPLKKIDFKISPLAYLTALNDLTDIYHKLKKKKSYGDNDRNLIYTKLEDLIEESKDDKDLAKQVSKIKSQVDLLHKTSPILLEPIKQF